jgi:hypothetical protein
MSRIPTRALASATGAVAEVLEQKLAVAGRATAMLVLAAGLLVSTAVAQAADEPPRVQSTAEEAGADSVRVQPTAKQFAPPHQPDVSAGAAHDIDELYRQLIGPRPAISSGSGSSAPPSSRAKR